MPTWRCPHCGTPQAEAARCWVCHRSSTSCGTCRHFRRAVAGALGYCGLDPKRRPLRGDEMRGCWEGALPDVAGSTSPEGTRRPPLTDERPRLTFVPVGSDADDARRPARRRRQAHRLEPSMTQPSPADPAGFWGEAEP